MTSKEMNAPELLPLKELSEFDTIAKCHKEIDRLRGLAFVWPYGNPPFPWKLVAEDLERRAASQDQAVVDDIKPAVYYCEHGRSLQGLEQGALAVLANLLIKTNAETAEFMIGNEKDGDFYFTCRRGADLTRAPQEPQTVPAGWEPIKTAPTNGDVFLVCLPRQGNLILRARFDRIHKFFTTDRMSEGIIQPTFFHDGDLWMSMPEPPADEVKE